MITADELWRVIPVRNDLRPNERDGLIAEALLLFSIATDAIVRHGEWMPMIALVDATGHVTMNALAGVHPRDFLPSALATHKYVAWVTVTDAYVLAHSNPEEARALYESGGSISAHPDRRECVQLTACHLPTELRLSFSQLYERDTPETGRVTRLDEIIVLVEQKGSELQSPWAFGPERLH